MHCAYSDSRRDQCLDEVRLICKLMCVDANLARGPDILFTIVRKEQGSRRESGRCDRSFEDFPVRLQ